MEFLDNMNASDSGTSNIKSDEINGEQHSFHSFPKEFQGWHNTQYMLEKKAPIDESSIPASLLNGFMWQAIGDATKFGLTSSIAIVAVMIKMKLSPNILGLIFSMAIFIPWMVYQMYHFSFYAKIRAQVVGAVTGNGFKNTSLIFYQTYIGVITSMSVAFIYVMDILEDILKLIRDQIILLGPDPTTTKDYYVAVHNFLIDLLSPPDEAFWYVLSNTYSGTFVFTAMILLSAYLFERKHFQLRKEIVLHEIEVEQSIAGYPIENAMRKITKWREEN